MKILMLSDLYPPFNPPIGGGMFGHVESLTRKLAALGHEVTVCTIKRKNLPEMEIIGNVKIDRTDGFFQKIPFVYQDEQRKFHPPIKDILLSRKLEKIIRREKPDIMHVHNWILYSIVALKKRYNIPLVVTLHDYSFVCPTKGLLRNYGICHRPFTKQCISCGRRLYGPIKSLLSYLGVKLSKRTLSNVDKFIAVSPYVKKTYSDYIDDDKIVVIPNFISFEPPSLKLTTKNSLPRDFVLYVGRLYISKGVDVLLSAFNKINKNDTKLVIIGVTEKGCSLPSEARNVVILKNLPRDEVLSVYPLCRFVIIPSIVAEACPTVALEAMAFKKAIIASDLGGLKDIIRHGETGLLVQRRNASELSSAIQFLLENPEIAEEMGHKGYERFKTDYGAEKVVQKIEVLYKKLIEAS